MPASNFLQVLEWTQTMLQVGEAFSGSESSSLRDTLQRHSGKFFHAFHTANLQVALGLNHLRGDATEKALLARPSEGSS